MGRVFFPDILTENHKKEEVEFLETASFSPAEWVGFFRNMLRILYFCTPFGNHF